MRCYNSMKRIRFVILLLVSLALSACGGSNATTAPKGNREIVNNYREGNLVSCKLNELYFNHPKNWKKTEMDDENGYTFNFDNGVFYVFVENLDFDVSDIDTEDMPVPHKRLSESQTIQYSNSSWNVQTFYLKSDDSFEGFIASTTYNENKYFIFAFMDAKYDMNEDFQQILDNLYFQEEKEDLSMYVDGAYHLGNDYPLVSMDEFQLSKYNNAIVAIDATLGEYRYLKTIATRTVYISFDVWINDGEWINPIFEFIEGNEYSPYFNNQFSGIDNGDIVRLYYLVQKKDMVSSKLVWIELLEKSTLEEQGIVYPVETEPPTTEPTETEDVQIPTETVEDKRMVYITNSGSKYHMKNCRWTKKSCIEITYEDAKRRGYTPCGTCNPLP